MSCQMPTISIVSKPKPAAIESTAGATNITSTIISGVSFIDEDLSIQIAGSPVAFITSFPFISLSLDVYLNGVKLSHGFDYRELPNAPGFEFIVIDMNFSKILNGNASILVKYMKRS